MRNIPMSVRIVLLLIVLLRWCAVIDLERADGGGCLGLLVGCCVLGGLLFYVCHCWSRFWEMFLKSFNFSEYTNWSNEDSEMRSARAPGAYWCVWGLSDDLCVSWVNYLGWWVLMWLCDVSLDVISYALKKSHIFSMSLESSSWGSRSFFFVGQVWGYREFFVWAVGWKLWIFSFGWLFFYVISS